MKALKRISAGIAALALTFSLVGPMPVFAAATKPSLGAAQSFSVLAALSASSANMTTITGDLGLDPGLAVSRTGPWTVGGTEYFGPATLADTAQADALIAFNNLAGQTSNGVWASATPPPGVWTIAADQTFNGVLTLNGGYTDVWVFQIGNDMTFNGSVVMGGNAQPCNVFFQVGNDATVTVGSSFNGTLIASNDVTLVSGVTVNGRVISLNSSLTVDANTISGPTCVAQPAGSNQGRLTVVKNVINDNGRTKTTGDFNLFVNGTTVVSGNTYTFQAPGTLTVTETADPLYTRTFSGDCNASGVVTLNPDDNKVCIVTNNDIGAPVVVPPVPPLIDVVKVPSPLALPNGPGPVTYTYTLRNVGTVPVTNVTMVGDTCSPITLISGDTNSNAILEVSETWVHRCTTNLSQTHTNTVVATGWANGLSAIDIASATVVVGVPIIPPLIHVTKIPNTLTLPVGGGFVTYTERITNPGTVPLTNVTLNDDKCSVAFVSGDVDNDSQLDVTETWTYTCRPNLTGTTVNTAVATGQANGLTVRDFATVTVVVAAAAPLLPSTGTGTSPLASAAAAGAILAASAAIYVLRKKQRA